MPTLRIPLTPHSIPSVRCASENSKTVRCLPPLPNLHDEKHYTYYIYVGYVLFCKLAVFQEKSSPACRQYLSVGLDYIFGSGFELVCKTGHLRVPDSGGTLKAPANPPLPTRHSFLVVFDINMDLRMLKKLFQ